MHTTESLIAESYNTSGCDEADDHWHGSKKKELLRRDGARSHRAANRQIGAERRRNQRQLGGRIGIGEAAAVPASMRYIRENFAERERGLPMGILMSGTKYGPAIGAPIATYLVMGFGWRWMFVLGGAPALLVGWIQSGVRQANPENRA